LIELMNTGALDFLLRNGADVNAEYKNGETPIFYSVSKQNFNEVSELLEYKANPNAKNRKRLTPLHKLLSYIGLRTESVAKRLIENGADVNAKDASGTTPLTSCLRDQECMNMMLLNFLSR
jgi:ankyrin repeat protein